MEEHYGRPHRDPGVPYYSTPSCIDCEHIQLGDMFERRCALSPDTFLFSPGYDPETERLECDGVQAEECLSFQLASEYTAPCP